MGILSPDVASGDLGGAGQALAAALKEVVILWVLRGAFFVNLGFSAVYSSISVSLSQLL